MTIIASISHTEQGAFLVGDSMLSNPWGLTRDANVPFLFQGNINKVIGEDYRLSAAGHAQKLVSIRDDLCFAWTGLKRDAYGMARFLREATKGANSLSKEAVLKLTEELLPHGEKVEFILLSALQNQTYFISSNIPVWPHDDDMLIRGSGSGLPNFVSNLVNLTNGFSHGDAPVGGVKKLYQALGYCGLAFLDQLTGDAHAGEGWGGLMETVYYSENRVQRAGPVTSFFWKGIEHQDGKWLIAFLPMFIHQYTDRESTVGYSFHLPRKRIQLIGSASPFETRCGPIDLPVDFPTNFTIHHLELESPRLESPIRLVVPHICSNPTENGVTVHVAGNQASHHFGSFWETFIPALPPGHEVSHVIGWKHYNPRLDWVTPFWRPIDGQI